MITLIPIEPLNEQHAMLIVEAFSRLFINRGGQSDGWGFGFGYGNIIGSGDGWGGGDGGARGDGWGNCGSLPEEWLVK